jgi:hypothetical protein
VTEPVDVPAAGAETGAAPADDAVNDAAVLGSADEAPASAAEFPHAASTRPAPTSIANSATLVGRRAASAARPSPTSVIMTKARLAGAPVPASL